MISLTDFFDAASPSHSDVILLPAIRRVHGNDCVPAGQCTAHVQQLNCCVKKRQTFLRPTCDLQTAQISVLWITRSGLSCSIVYRRQIHSVDELKQRLIDVSCGLEQSMFDETIDQWRGRHQVRVHAEGEHFEYSL